LGRGGFGDDARRCPAHPLNLESVRAPAAAAECFALRRDFYFMLQNALLLLRRHFSGPLF